MPKWNQFTEEHLGKITRRVKQRRVDFFVKVLDLGPNDRVLDLGSEDGSYLGTSYPFPGKITLADIPAKEKSMKMGVEKFGLNGFKILPLDGGLPFADLEFDVVWCNSVIEHVTVDRDEQETLSDPEFVRRAAAHQAAFAREIARVGKKYFVQTPYKHFPVESHSWFPFVQYAPQPVRTRLARIMKKVWVKQWKADFHLYDMNRFRREFGDATGVFYERALFLPKALIAYKSR